MPILQKIESMDAYLAGTCTEPERAHHDGARFIAGLVNALLLVMPFWGGVAYFFVTS